VYTGLAGVQKCFEGLFKTLSNTSDLAAPVIDVNEAALEVFLIWSCKASGIESATDTFIFDSNFKIARQNVVLTSKPVPTATTSVQASWDNHFAAFGAQNVSKILEDYTNSSIITVYDQTSQEKVVYTGLAGVQKCFEGLFKTLSNTSDLAAPVIDVNEAALEVFLIWSCKASGIESATDTFIFDSNFKISRQNVVLGATAAQCPKCPECQITSNHGSVFSASSSGVMLMAGVHGAQAFLGI